MVGGTFSLFWLTGIYLLLKLEQKASSNFDILDKRGQEGSEGVHKWRTSSSDISRELRLYHLVSVHLKDSVLESIGLRNSNKPSKNVIINQRERAA